MLWTSLGASHLLILRCTSGSSPGSSSSSLILILVMLHGIFQESSALQKQIGYLQSYTPLKPTSARPVKLLIHTYPFHLSLLNNLFSDHHRYQGKKGKQFGDQSHITVLRKKKKDLYRYRRTFLSFLLLILHALWCFLFTCHCNGNNRTKKGKKIICLLFSLL